MKSKKRIYLTIDNETYESLKTLSTKMDQKLSCFSSNIFQRAIEDEAEDVYFSEISDKRLSQKHKRIPSKKA